MSTRPFARVVDFLSGFGLSVTILFFMFVITLLGTWSQAEIGLFQSQKKYFESWLVIEQVLGPIHVPLPGGITLMVALAINLVLGGIVRLRHSWSRAGILVTHLGIALLLAAGAVKFTASTEGSLRLFEGETGNEYVSYHDWEIAIQEVDGDHVREWTVPQSAFADREGTKVTALRSELLPFELEVFGFAGNADIVRGRGGVDGFAIQPKPPEMQSEQDLAACYVRTDLGANRSETGILHALARYPWTVDVADRRFAVSLRRKRFEMPFAIELTKFTHEYHPGTRNPRKFESDVLVHEGGIPEPTRIEMNEPLRRGGVIAFQSSWGPQGAPPGSRLFSVFAVVENPSDQWPTWACAVIGLGMAWHFSSMLIRYVRREARARKELEKTT